MGQIISVIRRCLPLCFPLPESEDQNEASHVVGVADQNEDVQSNSTTRSTSTSMAAQTLPSSSESRWDHDVFLSFRGEDTRKNFTDHLYSALVDLGIRTFRDEEELPRGENISTKLLNAIRRSRIFIVVFSEGYASSRWCLDELVEIVHRKNTRDHANLLPIFYHVDPSDVRNQTRTFAEAFARHEKRFQTDMERVQKWRGALTEAASCSGWDLEGVANGYESRFIKVIVEEVLCKVKPVHLDVAEHPIGMKSRVDHIKDLLNLGTYDVLIVGIYGMAGIGKTTLAKAVYNEICKEFEGSSFLSNLKESSGNGLIHLQEKLLNDILKTNLKIDNVDGGIRLIKDRLHSKRVIVILDDLDDFDLHKLVKKQWFGPKSRIIVTTRNERLLTQLGVDEKYKVKALNHWESFRLFSWHAFKMYNPKGDYSKLSIEVVNYVGGLPLALVVLGYFLKERSIAEWQSVLKKLQRTPDENIQKILRISFDSLDHHTRDIFLDIACFFVGMDKEYAIKIFDDCDFSPGIGIPILIERSLVTIACQNKLGMHNLIRDMGREIVCEESRKHPGKRSRLWFHKDVLHVLHKNTGSETVEGLMLNLPEHLKTEAFTKMENLRLLQINDVNLTGSYEHLSKELKWLCWHKCPLKFLPQNFHLANLIILDMQDSNVQQVWETNKIFNKWKVLNLSNSKDFTRSPDFSQIPNLEMLILEGCTSLVQVHESIGYLKRLVLLNFKNCMNLEYLPRSIFNLESLETLDLSGCSALKKLSDQLGNTMDLTKLLVDETTIKRLPPSFGVLKNLTVLRLSGCSCLTKLPNLLQAPLMKELYLEGCTSLVEIHESIGCLKRLVSLDLKNCTNLKDLPISIFNLKSLKALDLFGCLALEKLPDQFGNTMDLTRLLVDETAIKQLSPSFGILKNLIVLRLSGCSHLTKLPNLLQAPLMEQLYLGGCTSLVEIHESIGCLKRLDLLDLKNCTNLKDLPISIFNLKSLKTLNLSDCLALEKLPDQFGNTMDLTRLLVDGTAIKQLPPSFGVLINLRKLSLNGCSRLTELPNLFQTPGIKWLELKGCTSLLDEKRLETLESAIKQVPFSSWISPKSSIGISLSPLPHFFKTDFEGLLTTLDLSRNNFRNLPSCIRYPRNLLELRLEECTNLQSISLPKSVRRLYADGCTSLERILISKNQNEYIFPDYRSLSLNNCHKLVEVQSLESLGPCSAIGMGGCNNLSSDFRKSVLQMLCKAEENYCFSVCFPGSEIPNWFSHQTIGSLISFRLPSLWDSQICRLLLCVVYAANKKPTKIPKNPFSFVGSRLPDIFVKTYCNKTRNPQKSLMRSFGDNYVNSFEDHIWAGQTHWYDTEMNSGDEIEVSVKPRHIQEVRCRSEVMEIQVKKLGIHLLFDDPYFELEMNDLKRLARNW